MDSHDAREGIAALAARLRVRDNLTSEEEEVLLRTVAQVRHVRTGAVIVGSGKMVEVSTLLIDGVIARYKDLANGQRQIQELHVRGDFVDLHAFVLKRLDHSVGAISKCTIALVPHERLKRLTEEHPHVARLLWLSTMLDASIQRETILSIGRRPAVARIAHLFCELCLRLKIVGLSDGCRFQLPMTQIDLADATGLTPVHVNRMLRELRDGGLLSFRKGEAEILDWDRLVAVAEFEPDYLHFERIPR